VLERRPDVAAAERVLKARCADIGIATANLYPRITLTGAYGHLSAHSQNWFDQASRFWSFGPQIHIPIFQGGRLKAEVQKMKALYDEALGRYREVVLTAFQEVEDALSSVHFYGKQRVLLEEASQKTYQAARLMNVKCQQGLADYVGVVVSDVQAIEAQLHALGANFSYLAAYVALVKATGGSVQ
jgi:multidrug efflux system outer membrane protein